MTEIWVAQVQKRGASERRETNISPKVQDEIESTNENQKYNMWRKVKANFSNSQMVEPAFLKASLWESRLGDQ